MCLCNFPLSAPGSLKSDVFLETKNTVSEVDNEGTISRIPNRVSIMRASANASSFLSKGHLF